MMRFRLVLLALVLAACTTGRAASPPQSPPPPTPVMEDATAEPSPPENGNGVQPATPPAGPITSAGDPAAPVPFKWTIHESHRPDGHRIRLQGGTLHAIASEVRLLNPAGQVIASVPATPLGPNTPGLCEPQPQGTVEAALALPASDLPSFRGAWPPGYRVEANVAGTWRPTELTFAGCATIE